MPKKAKRKGGRPARTDNPTRLVTRIAASLKRRLLHRAVDEGRPAGAIIADALVAYLDAKEGGR